DFIENHSIDPVVLVEKHENYYLFLLKMKEEISAISKYEGQVLTMLSLELLNGKRLHEIILLKMLLEEKVVSEDRYIQELQEHHCIVDENTIRTVERVLNLDFFTKNSQKKYGTEPIVIKGEENIYTFNEEIKRSLSTNPFYGKLIV